MKRIIENIIFFLALLTVFYLAWLTRHIGLPSLDSFLSLFKIMGSAPLYTATLSDLQNFKGGYARDIWGLLIYFSMGSLILKLGSTWTRKIAKNSLLESIVVNWAMGCATMALIWFALACFGLFESWIAYSFVFFGFIIGIYHGSKIFGKFYYKTLSISDLDMTEKTILTISVILFFLLGVNAFIPETWVDALDYHLGLPSYYIANHFFKPDPYNSFSYLNQNAEMLCLWGILAKSEVAVKLLTWTFLVMTSAAIYLFTKKYSNRFCALLSILLILLMPIATMQSIVVGNDLEMTYYVFVGWFMFSQVFDRIEKQGVDSASMLIVGGCFGAGIGTKYNALVLTMFCFLAATFLIKLKWNENYKVALKRGFFPFMLGIFIFAGPWMIRNFINTGNPVYPFYHGIFGKPYIRKWHGGQWIGKSVEAKKRIDGSLTNYREYFREFAGIVPGTPHYQVGWIMGLFVLAIISFFYRDKIFIQVTCIVSVFSLFVLSRLAMTPRYALVCVVFLCLPTAVALESFSKKKILRIIIFFIIFSNLFFHATMRNTVYGGIKAFALGAVGATPERFQFKLTERTESRIDEMVALNSFALKNIASEKTKVLMIGMIRPYRFELPFSYSSSIDMQYIDELLDESPTALAVRNTLIAQGFQYILFDRPAWSDYLVSVLSRMNPAKEETMKKLFTEFTSPLFNTEHLDLLKIN